MCTNQNLEFEALILVCKQLLVTRSSEHQVGLPSARRYSTVCGKTGRQSFVQSFPRLPFLPIISQKNSPCEFLYNEIKSVFSQIYLHSSLRANSSCCLSQQKSQCPRVKMQAQFVPLLQHRLVQDKQ